MSREASDETSSLAHKSSNVWTKIKAFGNGIMDYFGVGKEKETPEPLPEYCHLGCEPNDLARQAKQYKYSIKEKLGLSKDYTELEPSPSETQEQLKFSEE